MARAVTRPKGPSFEEKVDLAVDYLVAEDEPPGECVEGDAAMPVWAARHLAIWSAALDDPPHDPELRDGTVDDALERWGDRPHYRRRGLWWKLVLLALVLTVGTAVLVVKSAQSAVYGDRLWGVKRWTEGYRSWRARGAEAEVRVSLANTAERLDEVSVLAGRGATSRARGALDEFYREFAEVRWRIRATPRYLYPDLWTEAEGQLAEAARWDERLNGEARRHAEAVGPVAISPSPTEKPPWLPASPMPANTEAGPDFRPP